MSRSTVQRATGSSGQARLCAFHNFRAPKTPKLPACRELSHSSTSASLIERVLGGRVLRA
jgi:hypothetical protein